MSSLAVLHAVDRLYESVVTTPEHWTEQSFVDWAGDVATMVTGQEEQRSLRRVLRMAGKLQRFWSDPNAPTATTDWRSRVDLAAGPQAWRPTLDLAQSGLEARPDPELYGEVQQRFRLVHSALWMDGVDFDTWLAQHLDAGPPDAAATGRSSVE